MLEFLLKRGGSQCVRLAEDLIAKLEHLGQFAYISVDGRDQGVNVRHRCGFRPGCSGTSGLWAVCLTNAWSDDVAGYLSWAWVCCSSCATLGLRHQGRCRVRSVSPHVYFAGTSGPARQILAAG